jgi:hypothetical protein
MKLKRFDEINEEFEYRKTPMFTSLLGKDLIGDDCEYYGKEELYYVYNKKEDWYIQFDHGVGSTNRTWRRSCTMDLYENVVKFGYNWKYVLEDQGFDEEKIITREEFFNFLHNSLN